MGIPTKKTDVGTGHGAWRSCAVDMIAASHAYEHSRDVTECAVVGTVNTPLADCNNRVWIDHDHEQGEDQEKKERNKHKNKTFAL